MRDMTARSLWLPVLVLAGAAALAACGDSDDGGGDGADEAVVAYLIENDATQEEADCFAGELSEYDADTIIEALEGEEPPDDEDLTTAIFAAAETCDASGE